MYRVRRPAGSHHAAATPLRGRPEVDQRRGVPGRHRRDESAPRTGVDPVGDLLRLAATRGGRRDHRRSVLHRSRLGADPRSVGALPERPSATGDPRRRRRRRGRRRGRRRAGRVEPDPGQLDARSPAPATPALDDLCGRRRGGGDRSGPVRRAGADRRRHRRGPDPARAHSATGTAVATVGAARSDRRPRRAGLGRDSKLARCPMAADSSSSR